MKSFYEFYQKMLNEQPNAGQPATTGTPPATTGTQPATTGTPPATTGTGTAQPVPPDAQAVQKLAGVLSGELRKVSSQLTPENKKKFDEFLGGLQTPNQPKPSAAPQPQTTKPPAPGTTPNAPTAPTAPGAPAAKTT